MKSQVQKSHVKATATSSLNTSTGARANNRGCPRAKHTQSSYHTTNLPLQSNPPPLTGPTLPTKSGTSNLPQTSNNQKTTSCVTSTTFWWTAKTFTRATTTGTTSTTGTAPSTSLRMIPTRITTIRAARIRGPSIGWLLISNWPKCSRQKMTRCKGLGWLRRLLRSWSILRLGWRKLVKRNRTMISLRWWESWTGWKRLLWSLRLKMGQKPM